jgi:hypothetical protein
LQCVLVWASGNKHGLLLPNTATDQELLHIRNALPVRLPPLLALAQCQTPLPLPPPSLSTPRPAQESVVVQRVEERLSALGNVIACNDHVALVHSDVDRCVPTDGRGARGAGSCEAGPREEGRAVPSVVTRGGDGAGAGVWVLGMERHRRSVPVEGAGSVWDSTR